MVPIVAIAGPAILCVVCVVGGVICCNKCSTAGRRQHSRLTCVRVRTSETDGSHAIVNSAKVGAMFKKESEH